MNNYQKVSNTSIANKEKIIELVKGLHLIHNGIMKASHYDKLASNLPYPTLSQINSLFGSWSNLLLEAGIVTSDSLMSLPNLDNTTIKKQRLKNFSVEDSLRLCSNTFGNRFTIKDYTKVRKQNPKMLSINSILYHYGTWKNALQMHGYNSTRSFTNDDCLIAVEKAILDMNTTAFHISSTMYVNWLKEHPEHPSLTTLIARFGSWSNTLNLLKNR